MRAGRLRNKIIIQEPIKTENSVGEIITTWGFFAERMFAKEPYNSVEPTEFGQQQTITKVRFVGRYLPGVTSEMRILSDGLYYGIEGAPIDPDSRHKELIINTLEKSYDQG